MLDALVKGITLGLLLAISVGPIVFTVIKQSLNNGLKGGLAFIIGIFFSDIFLVICCNFFTHFFTLLSNYSTQLGIAGSVLLILVGIYFLFFKKVKISAEGQQMLSFNNKDYARMFIAGSIMNLLNPGIIVFWFTTATAFVSYAINKRIVIFGVALIIALSADVAKVVLADKLRKKLTPKNIHRINKINGVILIGFGIALLWGLLVYGKAGGH
ncbi:MAG: lysine transporter LysE [Chitinophagaceae bacterium]|nr:MAG: lysine transporter LysE [Chitinophagaceae bacterium]